MKYKDYYETLGVEKGAEDAVIRKAYRKLAKKYHPDVNLNNPKSEERFKEITEAYEVLGDKDKRQKYDQFGDGTQFQGDSEFDPNQYGFNGYTRSYSNRPGASQGTGQGSNYSDFFRMFFGDDIFGGSGFSESGFGGQSRQKVKGANIEAEITITVQESFHGVKKSFRLSGNASESKVTVAIPKGIDDGGKIRLKGKGQESPYGGQPGDLILTIHVESRAGISREGLDLIMELEIYPWEAALGTMKSFQTLDKNVTLKIPKGIQTGKRIRLKDAGFTTTKGEKGHLIAVIKIVNPKHLDEEMIKLYEAMEKNMNANNKQ